VRLREEPGDASRVDISNGDLRNPKGTLKKLKNAGERNAGIRRGSFSLYMLIRLLSLRDRHGRLIQ